MLRNVRSYSSVLAAAVIALAMSAASAGAGGPLILAGHDPDDHGFEAEYAELFDVLLANATNGGSGILAIGADPGTDAGDWIAVVATLMSSPQTVTYVNDASIATQSFSGFAIIHVPSTDHDTAGGIDADTEQPLLVGRAVDIATFINGGGAVFGLTQDEATDAYEYLGLFAGITAIGLPPSGDCGGGEDYDDVTPTPLGESLGITDTNVDGCCWHNVFSSFPSFLQTLAVADEPGCTSPAIDGLSSVIGCLSCDVPGQKSLAPALGFNPIGTDHTVTATLLESVPPNGPIAGVLTTFAVLSGPNAGESGADTTDASGDASFTYTGVGGAGVDRIRADCTDPVTSDLISSNVALKFWDADCNANATPDTCDLDCAGFGGDCLTFGACGAAADTNANGVPDECDECLVDATCDDGVLCNGVETCAAGSCQPGTPPTCDDGVACTDDSCDALADACVNAPNTALCDDTTFCNGAEICDAIAGCLPGTPPLCDDGNPCTDDACDAPSDQCVGTPGNEGAPCDDGNVCTPVDVCVDGVCTGTNTTCGNGTVEPLCGEVCEPPGTLTCDDTCQEPPFCRGAVPPPGVDCDLPDADPDLCDPCQLLCFPGTQPAPRRRAVRVAFVADEDYTGLNPDGNEEIYVFDLKNFLKRRKKGAADAQSLVDSIVQITDTTLAGGGAPAINEAPTFNASGRVLGFVSTADVFGDGISDDGNREVFQHKLRVKKNKQNKNTITVDFQESSRITATTGIDNRNPNLRAFRGNLLVFDSPADLVPDRCVGGALDLELCATDADCGDGACGNPEGNRELFQWVRSGAKNGSDVPLRQLTAAPSGSSMVGQSLNFNSRATAFSSDADLVGLNPDGLRQVYRIIKRPDKLLQITQLTNATTPGSTSNSPVQSRRRLVAFISDADLTGGNPGGFEQIFLWREKGSPPFVQITSHADPLCEFDPPAIDGGGRHIAIASTCALPIGTPIAERSLYFYDIKRDGFLTISVDGPGAAPISDPMMTRRARRAVFELLDAGGEPGAVCIFSLRKEQFEAPIAP